MLAQNPGPFTSAYEEAKGDIYVSQGDSAQALLAYKKAQSLKQVGASFSGQLLKMKIETLDDSQQDKLFPKTAVVSADETK